MQTLSFLSGRRVRLMLPLLLCLVPAVFAQSASATTVWTFDAPATATASQRGSYETVATLTLTQTADGVRFLLDPNELSSGYTNGGPSFIERLDYVYSGALLSEADFRIDDGSIMSFSFESNEHNMDSGYTAELFHIVVDFPSRNDPDRFDPTETRTWTVLGATLDQFSNTFATSHPKPSPIAGVISVTGYALERGRPTPSNWVAGTTVVPEPGSLLLTVVGLGMLAHRRRAERFL